FGAPVSGATVKYTITRSVYYHQYVTPTRFDWLYGSGWEKIYEKPYAGGEEFVMSGSGVTDEKGKLKITLPAAEKEAGHDFKYTVQTGVTDLSRRTIQGAGNVTVTKDPFFVYIYTRQGFYSPKDVIDVEVNAMTSSDAPVQMKGVLEVFRLTYPAGEEEKRELVHSEEISLDDAGRGFYGWKCGDEGQYMFVARGSYNNSPEVRREYIVNAVEKHFTPNRFKFREFDLTTEKRTYLRGEKIKILVSTPHKQATVWLTYEAGDEILEEKILELVEGSAILEVIADEKLSPNFFVRGVMVRDNGVFIKDREVFIPPGEEILDITVTPEKPDYKPGETGEFLLTVKDFKGKPVRAELSLAVFDSSVLYIQSETSGDIRPYYYGKRRYQNLYLQNSGTLWAMTLYENYNKYKEYEPAGLPFAYQYYGSAGWGYGTGGGYHYFTDGDYMEGANMKFKGGGGGLGMLRSLAAPDEVETKTAAKPASGEKAEEKMAMMDMAGDDAGKNKLFAA
ncbi:MAG: hypothetical protein FJ088_12170, partial [Deltaproteobacteria bacterium]|nr:hypothetical protein [Deltaproteobacteria bacterium]